MLEATIWLVGLSSAEPRVGRGGRRRRHGDRAREAERGLGAAVDGADQVEPALEAVGEGLRQRVAGLDDAGGGVGAPPGAALVGDSENDLPALKARHDRHRAATGACERPGDEVPEQPVQRHRVEPQARRQARVHLDTKVGAELAGGAGEAAAQVPDQPVDVGLGGALARLAEGVGG
jgi:hypothetical protein